MRTAQQAFGSSIDVRQKYGLTEKDDATGLNHAWFRKNENRAGKWTSPDPYKGSMSLGNPQSFNRYSYAENQPTNFVDPSGLLLCYGFHVFILHFEDGVLVGTDYLGFITTYCDGGGGGHEPSGGGGGGGHTSPSASGQQAEKDKCKFPGYDQLSAAQKKLVDKDLYNSLTDAQKANFLNQTGVLAHNGIDLGDARLQPGGIRTDRLFFDPSNLGTFQSSVNSAIARGVYSASTPNASDHPGMSSSGARKNRTLNSQQIGFGPDGAFVDIDLANPDNGLFGLLVHAGEVAINKLTNSKTDPFAVGRNLGSEVTGYTCKK
jgi:RHS repeat-associated protein